MTKGDVGKFYGLLYYICSAHHVDTTLSAWIAIIAEDEFGKNRTYFNLYCSCYDKITQKSGNMVVVSRLNPGASSPSFGEIWLLASPIRDPINHNYSFLHVRCACVLCAYYSL